MKKIIALTLALLMSFSCFSLISFASSSTHVKKTSILLTLGETYNQKLISAKGKDINNENISWSSKNKDIATISKNGKITSKKAGTANMVAKYKNKTYKFTVKVKKATLNYTKKNIFVGNKVTLKLYDANNKQIDVSKLTFKSSDKSIATVSKKGSVLGVKKGTVTVTVSYKDKSYKSTITVKSNLTVDKTAITMKEDQSKKVLIRTTENLESLSYEVVKGDNIIDCSWSKWDGNDIYLKIKALDIGSAKIKVFDVDNENDYSYIKVSVENDEDITLDNEQNESKPSNNKTNLENLKRMAACGINEAYRSAKYPSTLHLRNICYKEGETNRYGDVIDRMVLICYAGNGFGGFGEIYVVVLRCDSGENYPKSTYYPGYGYIIATAFDGDPGLEKKIFDNKTAMDAYQKFYNTDKIIPYD